MISYCLDSRIAPIQIKSYLVKVPLNVIIVKQDLLNTIFSEKWRLELFDWLLLVENKCLIQGSTYTFDIILKFTVYKDSILSMYAVNFRYLIKSSRIQFFSTICFWISLKIVEMMHLKSLLYKISTLKCRDSNVQYYIM